MKKINGNTLLRAGGWSLKPSRKPRYTKLVNNVIKGLPVLYPHLTNFKVNKVRRRGDTLEIDVSADVVRPIIEISFIVSK